MSVHVLHNHLINASAAFLAQTKMKVKKTNVSIMVKNDFNIPTIFFSLIHSGCSCSTMSCSVNIAVTSWIMRWLFGL